jgi:hypothetical protein
MLIKNSHSNIFIFVHKEQENHQLSIHKQKRVHKTEHRKKSVNVHMTTLKYRINDSENAHKKKQI